MTCIAKKWFCHLLSQKHSRTYLGGVVEEVYLAVFEVADGECFALDRPGHLHQGFAILILQDVVQPVELLLSQHRRLRRCLTSLSHNF